jgi:hypothetical protein
MKTSHSPAEYALTYLASHIGKQLSDNNHFTVKATVHNPSLFSSSTVEDAQRKFETDMAAEDKANLKALPRKSERMGEVPTDPLSGSKQRTFAFKVYPVLLPVKDAPKTEIGNVEEYIVTSLLTGEISPTGIDFSKCSVRFNPEAQRIKQKYDLFRKESEQADRYFYTDPIQMQEVLYKTIAQAKASGFTVDENKLSKELARQAKKLSAQNLDELTSLESGKKKSEPNREAFIAAGYFRDSRVACHINGAKVESKGFIIEHYVTGVREQTEATPQVVSALQRNAELNESLAMPVAKPILKFLANSELKVKTPEGDKDFIVWASDKHMQLHDDKGMLIDPLLYAVQKGRAIDGQDPLEWAIRNNQKIEKLEAGLWAVENDKKINSIDALEWLAKNAGKIKGYSYDNPPGLPEAILTTALEKKHKIEGREPIEWMLEHNVGVKRFPPVDLLVWAHNKGHLIQGKDAYNWAIANDEITKIGGQDKFKFMIEEFRNIDKQNPLVWCINNNKQIEGKDAKEWVKDNGSHKGVVEFYKYLVMFNKDDVAKIGGKDPVIWVIEQGLKPDGKDAIDYLKQEPMFTKHMHPVKWLQDHKGFDYVEHAFNKGLKIDNMHPVEWAQKNNFKIKPEIQFQYDVQQFEAVEPENRKAVIVQAAYAGKQDLLNEVAKRGKVDVYEPLAEAYIGLKDNKKESELSGDVKEKRAKLETAYEGVLKAQGKTPLGKDSAVGKLAFSHTLENIIRNFKHVSSTSKNRLPVKDELKKGFQADTILQKYTLPVVEKVHEIGQAIAKTDREKPKGVKATLQRCADWFSSIFAQNVKGDTIKAAKRELLGQQVPAKDNVHTKKVIQERAKGQQSGITALGA